MSASDPSARRIHLTSAVVVLATFIAGAAAGIGVTRSFGPEHRGPRGGPVHMRPPWLDVLNLTAEQQPAAQKIFDKHHEAMQAIIKESFPRVQAINETMESELKSVLTPEQQARLEEIKKLRPPMGGMPMGPPPPPQ